MTATEAQGARWRRCFWNRKRPGAGRRAVYLAVIAAVAGFMAPLSACAQVSLGAEGRAFQRAMDAFKDGHFERAERAFGEFVKAHPGSPLLTEATLLQAQSALSQTNTARAIAIINAALPNAGLLQDQYRYCLGNAYLESGNYPAAAATFAAIGRTMTNSSLMLEAGYGEALARFRLGGYAEVTALLQDPAGAFQRAVRTRPADKLAINGKMLLAESQFRQRQFKPAEETLQSMAESSLLPEVRWERQYLLCRLMVGEQRYAEALSATTNLLSLATPATRHTALADSYLFQAGLLRLMGDLNSAAVAYTNNLAETMPPEHRRLALLNIVELKLSQDKTTEAIAMLDSFLARHPGDAITELVQLTRGELELKLHLTPAALGAGTNGPPSGEAPPSLLQSALGRFDALLATNTSGPIRGKALLNKGWCLWFEQKFAESAGPFAAAILALPFSEDQAIARFKLADAYFAQKDYTNAIAHYRMLTNDFAGLPSVRSTLFDQALHQILQACVALGDEAGASEALQALLNGYPDSALAARSLFLVGQELMKRARLSRSREILLEFIRRFPTSALRPEAELVVARTFVEERAWDEAIAGYEAWLARHSNSVLRSRASFNLAWATGKSGRLATALMRFTNFIAEFATDTTLTPKAQYWIGDYYHRIGQYRDAVGNFQKLIENTNWPVTTLTYQARLMAGRSAFSAQLWKDAEGHFRALVADDTCPPDIRAQAYFAYADTLLNSDLPQTPQAQPIDKFKEAKEAFSRIPLRFTNSPIVAAAWGRIGDCHLQMASQDPKQYAEATNAYLRAITDPTADVEVRTLAELALARTLELQSPDNPALVKAAFDRYYNIVIGENLREGESSVPTLLEKAGVEAARIAESLSQWDLAIAIYQRLHNNKSLEAIYPRLEELIRRVQEHRRREPK